MTPKVRCIVDTDAGPDDLMALAYLLASPAAEVEAITTTYGLCPTRTAAENILRILSLCGRADIPVFVGQDRPLVGDAAFPERWRWHSSTLPGVRLPEISPAVSPQSATAFLQHRMQVGHTPVHLLALGPLTNVASLVGTPCPLLKEVILMGGAFHVSGNVMDHGEFCSPTRTAEWNMFADPMAAQKVCSSPLALRVVPLDATRHVPLMPTFMDAFAARDRGALHRLVCDLFSLVRPFATSGHYCAWDPLAAAALVDPPVITQAIRSAIRVTPACGTTRLASSGPVKTIALQGSREYWEESFSVAFT